MIGVRAESKFTAKFGLVAASFVLFAMIGLAGCGQDEAEDKIFKIGVVTNNPNGLKNIQGFQDGMAKLGYVADQNVTYLADENAVKGGYKDTLQAFIDDGVDMIFTAGSPTGVAAYKLTKTSQTPVVFGVLADPVRAGVMTDLTMPGGNMTGVKLNQNQALRFELFMQIVPGLKNIAVPYNPNDSAPSSAVSQLTEITQARGINLLLIECRDNDAVTEGLKVIAAEADSIFLVPDSVVNKRIKDIVKLSLDRKLPVSGPSGAQVQQGALMSYGISHHDVGTQAARIAAQILQGVEPGKIPVETARSFIGFNLQTAEQVGVKIPSEFIRQAKVLIRPEG